MLARSGPGMNSSFYIGRKDNSSEYKATVKTVDGPKEKTCSNWDEAVSWVDGVLEEERRRDEIERAKG